MTRTIKQPLLVSAAPATQDDTTHPVAYAVVADASGVEIHDVGDASEMTLTVTVHQAPDGTSPTLDAKLQESNEKVGWADVAGASITQFSGTAADQPGTETAKVPGPAVTDARTFARYVRVMAKVGGSSTPTYTVTYYLYAKE